MKRISLRVKYFIGWLTTIVVCLGLIELLSKIDSENVVGLFVIFVLLVDILFGFFVFIGFLTTFIKFKHKTSNSIVITDNKSPSILKIIIVFALIYILLYGVGTFISDYQESNQKISEIDSVSIPTPFPSPTITSIPIRNAQIITNTDPVEPCTSKYSGDSINVKRSECSSKYTDCQVGNTWKVVSKDECTKLQSNLYSTSTNGYRCLGLDNQYHTYKTQADCDLVTKWRLSAEALSRMTQQTKDYFNNTVNQAQIDAQNSINAINSGFPTPIVYPTQPPWNPTPFIFPTAEPTPVFNPNAYIE